MKNKRRYRSTFLKFKNGHVIATDEKTPEDIVKENQKIMKTDIYNILKIIFFFSIIGICCFLIFNTSFKDIFTDLQYTEESFLTSDAEEFNENVSSIISKINLSKAIEDQQEYDDLMATLNLVNTNNEIITKNYTECKTIIIDFTENNMIRRQCKLNFGVINEDIKKQIKIFNEQSKKYTEYYLLLQSIEKRYSELLRYTEDMFNNLNRETCIDKYNNFILTDKNILASQRNGILVLLDSKNIKYTESENKIIVE